MTDKELIDKTENAIQTLYQNREIEGLEQVKDLLPIFQNMLQEVVVLGVNDEVLYYFSMLKELVEQFQKQSMLGMADCLEEKAIGFIQYYCQTMNKSRD